MKVVIPQDITDAGKDYLKEKGYEIVIGTGDTDIEAMKKQVEGADGILARTAPYPAEVLAAAKNLKVIGRHGRTIKAIRTLARALAARLGTSVEVEVLG